MSVPRRRRASVGRVGDIANPDVVDVLEGKVSALLAIETGGVVTIASRQVNSLEIEFVLSNNVLLPQYQAAVRRAVPRQLGHGWSMVEETRYLPVANLPSSARMASPTLVLQYHSRAVGGWSFGATLVAAGISLCVAGFLLYYLYWLLVVVRAN